MTSSTDAAGSITEATALLQAELPELERHQQALEEELASVTGRLESVRSALTALQALSAAPVPAPRGQVPGPAAPAESEVLPVPKTAGAPVEQDAEAVEQEAEAVEQDAEAGGGGLTEQVMDVLARRAGTALRARDVAEALGRDGSPGSINTVRSTLDRLVATSRAHRAGRGLYEAVPA